MSTWYDFDVKVMSNNSSAVAKFFNLNDTLQDVRTDWFEFSFSGKNGPSLNLNKLIEQNPDFIFLVKCSIESENISWSLSRFDRVTDTHQTISIQNISHYGSEINTKILEAYTTAYPTLPAKHFANEKGYEGFRWSMFFNNYEMASFMLSKFDQYETMRQVDVDDDFNHLEM